MKRVYLLLTLALAGCAPSDPAQKFSRVPDYVEYQVGPERQRAHEFMLLDGTRCVAYNARAITCEWQRPVVIVPRPE